MGDPAGAGRTERDVVAATEEWFLHHGLSYFVPAVRGEVRARARARRFVPVVVAAAVLGALVGLLGLLLDPEAAAAIGLSVALVVVAGYGLVALQASGIVRWAVRSTFGSLRLLLPMASRALPLLLVFVTFLFINTEAWQMTSALHAGTLWVTVVLLTAVAVLFLLTRLPEEVDRVDDAVDPDFVRRTVVGTPVASAVPGLLEGDWDPAEHAQVTGWDRWNLILVLLVVQVLQVLLLMVAVFVFFVLFGTLVMSTDVQHTWTIDGQVHSFGFAPTLSDELLKVSFFLAGFSGLYFTVSAVTDDTYRGQFFAAVTDELERAVGVRTAYLALVERAAPT